MGRIAIVLLTAIALFATEHVRPERADRLPGVTVTYADLDLRTAAGAKAALVRIRRAAADVCGAASAHAGPDLGAAASRFEACRRETTDRAVKGLNAPVVSLLYDGGPVAPDHIAAANR